MIFCEDCEEYFDEYKCNSHHDTFYKSMYDDCMEGIKNSSRFFGNIYHQRKKVPTIG